MKPCSIAVIDKVVLPEEPNLRHLGETPVFDQQPEEKLQAFQMLIFQVVVHAAPVIDQFLLVYPEPFGERPANSSRDAKAFRREAVSCSRRLWISSGLSKALSRRRIQRAKTKGSPVKRYQSSPRSKTYRLADGFSAAFRARSPMRRPVPPPAMMPSREEDCGTWKSTSSV